MDLSQQARQSPQELPCSGAGQVYPTPVETPLVTTPRRFAIALGILPSIIRAESLIQRFSGIELPSDM